MYTIGGSLRMTLCALFLVFGVALSAAPNELPRSEARASEQEPRLSRSWKRIRHAGLEAVGDVSEKELREAFAEIDSFRAAFKTLYPKMNIDSPRPTRVVVFPDQNAMRPFGPRDSRGRPQQNVGGYFAPADDLNIIVLGGNRSSLMFHEFAHSFLDRNFRGLPRWLNEGLAEFHSTFEADWKKGQSLIGRPPAGRVRWLRSSFYIPIEKIVHASPADMEKMWRDDQRISMYYAQSWAIVHYLMLEGSAKDSAAFSRFVIALETGTPVEQALQRHYGMTLDQLDDKIRRYANRPSFYGATFRLHDSDDPAVVVERMTEADVKHVRGDLLVRMGESGDARKEIDAAMKLDPDHLPARIAVARIHAAENRLADAIALLRDVLSASPGHVDASQFLAGFLREDGQYLPALEVYDQLVKRYPASAPAWFGLSMCTLALGRMPQSNAAMNLATQLEYRPAWYRTRAYAAFAAGQDRTAADSARRYVDLMGWDTESAHYTGILGAVAHRRLEEPERATELLAQAEAIVQPQSWTSVVIDFLQERLAADAFLERARSQGEKTEAHAYIGFELARAGRVEEAITHFRWVKEQGARNYVEYHMAVSALRRLETPPAVPSR